MKHEWQWTNEDDGHAVILVTETYDCDRNKTDGTTRQPWLVSEIAFDDGQYHVELLAEAVSFQEAFGLAWHVSIARDTVSIPHITRDTHPGQISLNSNFSGVWREHEPATIFSLEPDLSKRQANWHGLVRSLVSKVTV